MPQWSARKPDVLSAPKGGSEVPSSGVSSDDASIALACWLNIATAGGQQPMPPLAEETLNALTLHLGLGTPSYLEHLADVVKPSVAGIGSTQLCQELLDFGLLFVFLSPDGAWKRAEVLVRYAHELGQDTRPYKAFQAYWGGSKHRAMREMIRAARRAIPGSRPLGSLWMGLRGRLGWDRNRSLQEKFERYGTLKDGTVGRALFDYYQDNQYALPGMKGSWYSRVVASHDTHHVLTGYPTTPLGEMCVVAFAHGASRRDLSGNFPFVLLQFHLKTVVDRSQRPRRGCFDPDRFLLAYARGRRMACDLLEPAIDLHTFAEQPLSTLRREFGISEVGVIVGTESPSWSGIPS